MTFCYAQQYGEIDAQVDPLSGHIKVKQLFRYTNEASRAQGTLYLYDWNHAYVDTSTPLAAKLAQEFNFKFEKSHNTSIYAILGNKALVQNSSTSASLSPKDFITRGVCGFCC